MKKTMSDRITPPIAAQTNCITTNWEERALHAPRAGERVALGGSYPPADDRGDRRGSSRRGRLVRLRRLRSRLGASKSRSSVERLPSEEPVSTGGMRGSDLDGPGVRCRRRGCRRSGIPWPENAPRRSGSARHGGSGDQGRRLRHQHQGVLRRRGSRKREPSIFAVSRSPVVRTSKSSLFHRRLKRAASSFGVI